MATYSNGLSVSAALEAAQDTTFFTGTDTDILVYTPPGGHMSIMNVIIGQHNGIGGVMSVGNCLRIFDATHTVILESFTGNDTIYRNIIMGPGQQLRYFKLAGTNTISFKAYGVEIKNGM